MIRERYTLFTRIPVYVDAKGAIWAEQLWRKDLELHLFFIKNFYLCCPLEPLQHNLKGLVPVEGLTPSHVIPLRRDNGWGSIVRNFLPNFRTVRRAVCSSMIVHSSGAGWAFPLSFYILPLSLTRRFFWVVVIESSFWMRPASGRFKLRQFISHHLHALLLGWSLTRAHARIFTQDGYRQFFKIGLNKSLVAPAVWIDDDMILSQEDQEARLSSLPEAHVQFLFPARLVRDKGVEVVLAAIDFVSYCSSVRDIPLSIHIDLMGHGPLENYCRKFIEKYSGPFELQYLEPLPYGPSFFSLLRRYHCVLLANQQQEQPRVIFDAFSQGVPIISSDTDGVRQVATDGKDALLYSIGDAEALAHAILRFAKEPILRKRLSNAALNRVHSFSHRRMHAEREAFLQRCLEEYKKE